MGEDAEPRALGLRRRAAAGVRPVVGGRPPRRPVDVAGVRPVRHRLPELVQRRAPVGIARRPESVRNVVARLEHHLAELLPRRRLVVAGGDVEAVVEAAEARRAADGGPPERASIVAQVLVAAVPLRAVRRRWGVEPSVGDAVLVELAGQRVGPEHLDVDADLAVAVLHPVPVQRLAAVVLVRHGVIVVVPLRDVLTRNRLPTRLRIAERMRAGRLCDQHGLVLELEQDHGGPVLADGAVRARRVVPGVRPGLRIGVPRQLALVDPVLCVDRLEQRVVRGVRRDLGACGRANDSGGASRRGRTRRTSRARRAPGVGSSLSRPPLSPGARRRRGRMSPANPPADRSRRDRNTPQEWNSVHPRGRRGAAASVPAWITSASITTSRSRS